MVVLNQLRFRLRLCGNQRPEEKIVSTNEEMLLAFRSNWDYEFYHARKGFKAVIRSGKYFLLRIFQAADTRFFKLQTKKTSNCAVNLEAD